MKDNNMHFLFETFLDNTEMTTILGKVYNLMLNCNDINEFRAYYIEVMLPHKTKKEFILDLFNNGTIAADCTILPMYYLNSTTYGYKQDRTGKFYNILDSFDACLYTDKDKTNSVNSDTNKG